MTALTVTITNAETGKAIIYAADSVSFDSGIVTSHVWGKCGSGYELEDGDAVFVVNENGRTVWSKR